MYPRMPVGYANGSFVIFCKITLGFWARRFWSNVFVIFTNLWCFESKLCWYWNNLVEKLRLSKYGRESFRPSVPTKASFANCVRIIRYRKKTGVLYYLLLQRNLGFVFDWWNLFSDFLSQLLGIHRSVKHKRKQLIHDIKRQFPVCFQ